MCTNCDRGNGHIPTNHSSSGETASESALVCPANTSQFARFPPHQATAYTSIVYFVLIPCYWAWSWHSDHTGERIWHSTIPILVSLPCFAVWMSVSARKSFSGISPIALYGMAFLGKFLSVCSPPFLSYRSATLYGASEQAVGVATTLASVSIAAIIGPQVQYRCDISFEPLTDRGYRFTQVLMHHGTYRVLSHLAVCWYLLSLELCHCLSCLQSRQTSARKQVDTVCRCVRLRTFCTLRLSTRLSLPRLSSSRTRRRQALELCTRSVYDGQKHSNIQTSVCGDPGHEVTCIEAIQIRSS